MYEVHNGGSTIELPEKPVEAAKALLELDFSRTSIADGVVERGEETWTIAGGDAGKLLRAMAVEQVRWQRANVPEFPQVSQEVLGTLPAAPEWQLVTGDDRSPFLLTEGWMTGLMDLPPDPHRPDQPALQGTGGPKSLMDALNILTDKRYGLAVKDWRKHDLIPGLHYALWVSTRVAKEVDGVAWEVAMWVPVIYYDSGATGIGGPALETVVMFHV